MSTIQNLKNFIRHGKQARHGDPTTTVSPVNAHQQRYVPPPPQPQKYAISDPNILDHKPIQHAAVPGGDYSVAGGLDQRNVAAQAGGAAAKAADHKHKKEAQAGSVERTKDTDPSVIERIVAEERESKGKLPKYPGLERWTLIEKMGDGAFSNVYRAKDATGRGPEVAIKVVRKFEMSASQVSIIGRSEKPLFLLRSYLFSPTPSPSIFYHHVPPTTKSYKCQPLVQLGRQSPTSGFQEAAKGCGGGQHLPYLFFVKVHPLLE